MAIRLAIVLKFKRERGVDTSISSIETWVSNNSITLINQEIAIPLARDQLLLIFRLRQIISHASIITCTQPRNYGNMPKTDHSSSIKLSNKC